MNGRGALRQENFGTSFPSTRKDSDPTVSPSPHVFLRAYLIFGYPYALGTNQGSKHPRVLENVFKHR